MRLQPFVVLRIPWLSRLGRLKIICEQTKSEKRERQPSQEALVELAKVRASLFSKLAFHPVFAWHDY
jgi:hypothetical protein